MINPFPGLRPFDSSESELFFGRERHIGEILRKLDTYRFVSIVGNSGSGKSSLVRAGLLPYIKKNRNDWTICSMRPGSDPIAELYATLTESKVIDDEKGLSILGKHALGLVQLLRHSLQSKSILILVDQFEELFRFNASNDDEEQENVASKFVDLLLASAGQTDVNIYIVLTIRSDFLGDCEQFQGLPEAINDGQFLVPRMNREEMRSSLINPVKIAKGKISPQLVQNLLNQVGNRPDQLPVLQHVLMRSYNVWLNSNELEQPLGMEHYEATGGMNEALSRHVDEAFSELNKKQKKLAEIIFKTVTVKGSDNRGIRRPTSVANLAKIASCSETDIISTTEFFRKSDRGFLMPSQDVELASSSIIDISHESLMRKWITLKNWVDEEAQSAELFKRISESALLYEEDKAGLWRDPDLQIAKDWMVSNQPNEYWAAQYNPHFKSAVRFLEASDQQKKFLLADKQRKRKIRNITVVLVLIALSAISLWAFNERNNAESNAAEALEQKKQADEQRQKAETNFSLAKEQEEIANREKQEAENQRQQANRSAAEAQALSIVAQNEAAKSKLAEKQAELEREVALHQTHISDSLRIQAELATEQAQQLRLLGVSKNLAIRSKIMDDRQSAELKTLLSLHAFKLNHENKGNAFDKDIFEAIHQAYNATELKGNPPLRIHADEVPSIAISSSGMWASAGNDGKVYLTKNNGTPQLILENEHVLDNATFSPNSTHLVVSDEQHSLHILSLDASDNVQDYETGQTNKITRLLWIDQYIYSFSIDKSIVVFDAQTNSMSRKIQLSVEPHSAIALSAETIIIGSANGGIYQLDLNTDQLSKITNVAGGAIVTAVDVSSDNNIAYGTSKGQCGIVSPSGNLLRTFNGHGARISAIRYHPTDKLIATACYDGKVRLFNTIEVSQPAIEFDDHSSWVLDLNFTADGRFLISTGKDKNVVKNPISLAHMEQNLRQAITRDLTMDEWKFFAGEGLPFVPLKK